MVSLNKFEQDLKNQGDYISIILHGFRVNYLFIIWKKQNHFDLWYLMTKQVTLNEIRKPGFLIRIRISTFQRLQAENMVIITTTGWDISLASITLIILYIHSLFFNNLGQACLDLAESGKVIKTYWSQKTNKWKILSKLKIVYDQITLLYTTVQLHKKALETKG